MENIARLNRRTLFWIKGFFICCLVFFGLRIFLGLNYENVLYSQESLTSAKNIAFLVVILFFFLSCVALLFTMAIGGTFMLLWTFRMTKNLRTKEAAFFSPALAVIGLLVPFANILVQYGILMNSAKVQQKILDGMGVKVQPVPLRKLTIWFVLTLICVSAFYFEESNIYYIVYGLMMLSSIGCFIAFFSAFAAQHETLFQMEQESILNAKVEDEIRKREILKLASEIQEARYETPSDPAVPSAPSNPASPSETASPSDPADQKNAM